MIIKDEKLIQEIDNLDDVEHPPPYTPAPTAPRVIVTQDTGRPSTKKVVVVVAEEDNSSTASTTNYPSSTSTSSSTSTLRPSKGDSSTPLSSSEDQKNNTRLGKKKRNEDSQFPRPPLPQTVRRMSHQHARFVNTSVRRQFIIDPYLPLLPETLIEYGESDEDYGPLLGGDLSEGGAEIRNLKLEGKNSNIDAEVWIISDGRDDIEDTLKKAYVDVRTMNGIVSVRMHSGPASPFVLRVGSHNGNVHIALPRSFTGPMTLRVRNGWTSFSSSLSPNVTTFSEVHGTRKCFVGDFVESGYGRGDWLGSSVDATSLNGRIKICYYDESIDSTSNWSTRGSSAILGRLFGSF